MLTSKPNHPQLEFLRPLPTPGRFEPTSSWAENGFVYRYDPKAGICKRIPVSQHAGGASQFFAVRPLERPESSKVARQQERLRQRRLAHIDGDQARSLWRWRLTATGFGLVAVAALAVLVYPWLPEAGYRLRQATQPTALAAAASHIPADRPIQDNRLIVPKIGIDTPILESSSLNILDKQEGVWHQTGNQTNNFVLAGHRFRYLPPNTSTLYNLNKLEVGDVLAIDWLGKRTVYRVTQLTNVPASQVSILEPSDHPQLTIYTCTDIRQTQRTVITAEPLPAP
jgi:LPXTG-site transpeptidase (sortase) family protein